MTDVSTEAAADDQAVNESEIEAEPSDLFDVSKFVDSMSSAVEQLQQPKLQDHHKHAQLEELLKHQDILLESLEHENEKFSSSDCFKRMEDIMSKCKLYHTKLITIRKSMNDINSRTARLKKKCEKLQQLKMKSDVDKEEERRKELEREQLLQAKPVFQPETGQRADNSKPDPDAQDQPSEDDST